MSAHQIGKPQIRLSFVARVSLKTKTSNGWSGDFEFRISNPFDYAPWAQAQGRFQTSNPATLGIKIRRWREQLLDCFVVNG
ncbi:MAG: hypothetical protein IIB56_01660 [Planctomycetes bacterium]|nr:hypothetical protein [Planctomycetota bacterium]